MTWSPLPEASVEQALPPGFSVGSLTAEDRAARVTAIGAYCTLAGTVQPTSAQSFAVTEFAQLANGTLVALHSERGFTIGAGDASEVRTSLTRAIVSQAVCDSVLPDGSDVTELHPFDWLATLAQKRGLQLSSDDLRQLPYQVVLGQDVLAWLPRGDA